MTCPHCMNDNADMHTDTKRVDRVGNLIFFCECCSKEFTKDTPIHPVREDAAPY